MNKKVINELNNFLEGNFMAIHAYDQYIHEIEDTEIKQLLQKIQDSHKQHANIIARRIQDLGGVPANDVGLKGKMVEWMKNLTESTKGNDDILKDALVGEKRGIEISKELVKGDLDQESLELVQKILSHDEEHVEQLNRLLH
ncbi:DUF2383 domain-containing protein [Bacillus dakarensis]|uniref:DUF2383 domain-containing protein n=1 Tax=Robertmurraya dakarensis TaxID=1926278 RepID=UPI000981FEE7|nr:DUF2383 domain-containing protein [Bacillus dakarensis]